MQWSPSFTAGFVLAAGVHNDLPSELAMRGLPPNHRKNAESAFRPWTDKMSNRHEALRGLAHYAQPDWEHLEDGRVQRLVVGQVDETVAQSWNTDRLPSRKRFLPDETLQTVLRRVRIAMEHPWEE